ncbi:MAG: hypothetical protein P4L40_01660 [Terracidiphilus sp.]|nr:hypothetical protein [Terracidiphilus sp.]
MTTLEEEARRDAAWAGAKLRQVQRERDDAALTAESLREQVREAQDRVARAEEDHSLQQVCVEVVRPVGSVTALLSSLSFCCP